MGEKIYEIDFNKDFLSLLPNTTESVTNHTAKFLDKKLFINLFKGKQVKDFDAMINRPFLEVITLAFYFTDNE